MSHTPKAVPACRGKCQRSRRKGQVWEERQENGVTDMNHGEIFLPSLDYKDKYRYNTMHKKSFDEDDRF